MKTVVVSKKGAKRIRGGHLWVYRSDVVRVEAEGGDCVRVVDEARNFVGRAFYSDASEIAVRVFGFSDIESDADFWRSRIRDAASRRKRPDTDTTNARRLIFSEGDLIPSLIVDDYDGVFVIQTLSQGTEKLKSLWIDLLLEEFSPRVIIERNDVKVRLRENLPMTSGSLFGESPDEFGISQDGLRFLVSPLGGQKTGSFLDQRENHAAVREFAFGDALDCFTFNGGFALNLARVCNSVTALDISEDALALAGRNAELNGISNVEFKTANVFDALRDFERDGIGFDTIVLDPPAFVKSRAALRSAVRGYKEINLRALKLLRRGGFLVTCSCSFHFGEEIFLQTIEECLRDARRKVHLVGRMRQAADHPILLGVPETSYLKGFVLQVIE